MSQRTGERLVAGAHHHAPAMAVLFGALLLIFYPLYPLLGLATHLHGGDAYTNCYLVNWGQHILWTEPWNFFDLPLFHPQENMGTFTEFNPLMCFLTGPVRLPGNPVLSYNLMLLANGLLSGLAAYGVCHAFTRHRRASLVAGVVYAGNGDMIWHLWGHVNISAPIFLPIAYGLYIGFRRRGSALAAVGAGAAVLAQFLCSFYLGIITVAGLGVLWLIDAFARRPRFRKSEALLLGALASALGIAFLWSIPYQEMTERFGNFRGLHSAALFSADPVGYLVPSYFPSGPRTLLGCVITDIMPWEQRLENTQFFGYTALLIGVLALIQMISRWRAGKVDFLDQTSWCFLAVAVFGFVLSLGPFLWVGEEVSTIRLPYRAIYEWVAPLRFMRAASRYSLLVCWALVFLLAAYLSRARWFNGGGLLWRSLACLGIISLLFLEYTPFFAPGRQEYSLAGMESISRHADDSIISTAPFQNRVFLVEAAGSFPDSPAGSFDGVRNPHYIDLAWILSQFPSEETLAMNAALNVDFVAVYGEESLSQADRLPSLRRIEAWAGGGLYRLDYSKSDRVENARKRLESIGERPPLPWSGDFPADAPPENRWMPLSWIYIEDGEWKEYGWPRMLDQGFVYTQIRQRLGGGIQPRRLGDIRRVHIKLELDDVGVDYAESRVSWITEEHPDINSAPSAHAYIHTDGRGQVATYIIDSAADYRPDEKVTAFFLEVPTTPYPGLKLDIEEIRFTMGEGAALD